MNYKDLRRGRLATLLRRVKQSLVALIGTDTAAVALRLRSLRGYLTRGKSQHGPATASGHIPRW